MHYRQLRLVLNNFLPLKTFELMVNPFFVPCFCCLHDHDIVDSVLPIEPFLVVNVIEK
jgi:hypothetical protein